MKNIIKKSNIFILLTIIIVSLSGCDKSDVEENQEIAEKTQNEQIEQKTQNITLKFEEFIKEHGEEIILEKVDTTDWQEYIDEDRGFSFKYPSDWHAIPIDSSKKLQHLYSKQQQNFLKDYQHGIKGQTEPMEFLCIINSLNYNKIATKDIIDSYSDNKKYCNVIFSEYVTSYKKEKRVSGELWLDNYKTNKFKFLKYIIINDIYLYSTNIDLQTVNFVAYTDSIISIFSKNLVIRENGDSDSVFDSFIQTIQYIK